MTQTPVPITTGNGSASVAAEVVSGTSYQEIEVYGPGGASVLSINPDGSIKASIIGSPSVTITGNVTLSPSIFGSSIIGAPPANIFVGGTVVSTANPVPITPPASGFLVVNTSNSSVISTIQGSVATVVTVSSVATANGAVPVQVNGPLTLRVQGTADMRTVQGASVAAISAAGAGVRNYVDAVQVSNFGSSSVLVLISDNTTSVLGWTIAPAGGGSNFNPMYRGAANSPITASINGTASVLVSMQGFTSST